MTSKFSTNLQMKALRSGQFEGHGSIFGIRDRGGDTVMPGAFKKSLATRKAEGGLPMMLWMHDPSKVAGVWLEMEEDADGLYVKGELADTELGREMRTLLNMKAVRGLSIGYRTVSSGFDGEGGRLLHEVDLFEVSLVSLAMNPFAQVEAVKAQLSRTGEYVPTEREFEKILDDVGCSKSARRTIVSRMYGKTAGGMLAEQDENRRDAGEDDEDNPEALELLQEIQKLTDKTWAEAFRLIG